MPSPNPIPTEFESASFGQRAFALLIDTALFFGLFALPTKLPLPDGQLGFVILGVFILLASGYRIFGDAVFGGAAVGKRLLGIYVVDGATRRPCSLWQCFVRASGWVIPFAYFVEPIVLYSEGRQRYGPPPKSPSRSRSGAIATGGFFRHPKVHSALQRRAKLVTVREPHGPVCRGGLELAITEAVRLAQTKASSKAQTLRRTSGNRISRCDGESRSRT